jgi:hypothetical protein
MPPHLTQSNGSLVVIVRAGEQYADAFPRVVNDNVPVLGTIQG